ncbi:MAG: hypothetical protein ACREX3_17705 [Gammaproteobacteria bacterium]
MPNDTRPTALADALAPLPDEALIPVGFVRSLIDGDGQPHELRDGAELLGRRDPERASNACRGFGWIL